MLILLRTGALKTSLLQALSHSSKTPHSDLKSFLDLKLLASIAKIKSFETILKIE